MYIFIYIFIYMHFYMPYFAIIVIFVIHIGVEKMFIKSFLFYFDGISVHRRVVKS